MAKNKYTIKCLYSGVERILDNQRINHFATLPVPRTVLITKLSRQHNVKTSLIDNCQGLEKNVQSHEERQLATNDSVLAGNPRVMADVVDTTIKSEVFDKWNDRPKLDIFRDWRNSQVIC